MANTKTAGKGDKAKPPKKKSARTKTDSAALLEKFRAPAMKLKAAEVIACRADVRVAFANVKLGMEAVFGAADDPARKQRVGELEEALPKLPVKQILKLPNIARALDDALKAIPTLPPQELMNAFPKELLAGSDTEQLRTVLAQYRTSLYPRSAVIDLAAVGRVAESLRIAGLIPAGTDVSKLHDTTVFRG